MKRNGMLLFTLLIVLGVGVTDVWCQLPSAVKVGVVQPLTGALALNGMEVKEGAELAAGLINKTGGIKGKTKIELMYGDTRCSPTDGVNAVQRLISQGIDFVVGDYCSSSALAIMPIVAAEGIPQIILAYAPSITAEARTPNSVRIGPSAPLEMAPLAKYATKVKGNKRFASIACNNDFGRAMAEEFGKAVEKLGGKVLDYAYYPFGADFSTYLTKVKNMNVDGLNIIAMGNDPVSFTKSYYELGLKMNIYGGDNFEDTQYLEKQSPKPQNLFYPWIYNDDPPRSKEVGPPEPWIKEFDKEFKMKYGKDPTRNHAWGYACVKIIEQAVAALGTVDKKKVSDYLHSGAKFKTVFGEFGFQWCGQSVNKAGIGKFEGDKKLFLKDKNWGDDVIPDLCPPK